MPSTKIQRWLDLIGFLAAHRYPVERERVWAAVPAYASGLDGDRKAQESVRRTFERDKDELRELGIPIESVTFFINNREQVDGYRLQKKDFHLPYLRLLEEGEARPESRGAHDVALAPAELGAALEGLRMLSMVPSFPLRRHARSAARKLGFDGGRDVLGQPEPFIEVADAEAERSRKALEQLNLAVMQRKRATFDYHSMHRDTIASRTVHPYGLIFQLGRWYLVGFDLDRDDVRMYRLGRMREVAVNRATPGTPDYEVPRDFELRAYTDRSAWELGEDDDGGTTALVRFSFPRSIWAERNHFGELVGRSEDGSEVRSFQVSRRDPFLRWVLSQAGEAQVEEPSELRDQFADLLGSVRQLYEREEGGGPR